MEWEKKFKHLETVYSATMFKFRQSEELLEMTRTLGVPVSNNSESVINIIGFQDRHVHTRGGSSDEQHRPC